MNQQDDHPWWVYGCMITMISTLFALVPFWVRGITLRYALIAAAIIFPMVFATFVYVIWWEAKRDRGEYRPRD
jgi:hypothetical protein